MTFGGVGESITELNILFDVGSDAKSRSAQKSQQLALDICDVIEGEMDARDFQNGLPVIEPKSLRKWLTVIAIPGLESAMLKANAELPDGARETRMTVTLFKKHGIHADCVISHPGTYLVNISREPE